VLGSASVTQHPTSGAIAARIAAPTPPTPAQKRGFPLLATTAPVVMSLVMWLVTQSVYALLFAVLGPLVAVASIVDHRISSGRAFRVELRRFSEELSSTREEIVREHDRERRAIALAVPGAHRLASATDCDAVRWRTGVHDQLDICVGRGERASRVQVDFAAAARSGEGSPVTELEHLRFQAARLMDAELSVDASQGIGVHGPQFVVDAVARAILVQLAATLSPVDYYIALGTDTLDESWLSHIPHRVERDDSPGIRFRSFADAGATFVVALARQRVALPGALGVIIHAGGFGGELSVAGHTSTLTLDQLSEQQATVWAALASRLAEREKPIAVSRQIPVKVPFASLAGVGGACDKRGTLACSFAVGAHGEQVLDLVSDGPHAIVGGTTGSGKSELLIAWVLSIAQQYTPEHVSFLLFDFKGGSTFAELCMLRHCVGMISDLDARVADRALLSLAAELRRREQILRDCAVRTIDDLPQSKAIPRLVIVVDEFAAMAAEFPELNSLFGDLAARGRSLGIHLILCTQRPAGSIRETVLANAALRISLRVNSKADSMAVIGTDDAASLPSEPRGRALLSLSSGPPIAIQAAIAESRDIAAIAARWEAFSPVPRRPWLEPLPLVVHPRTIAAHATERGIPIGISDAPHDQAQPIALYCPVEDGHLLVVGGSRSGKTSFLQTLSAAASGFTPISLPDDIEGAWDCLHSIAMAPREASKDQGRLLLVDNFDATIAGFADEYQVAFIETIVRLLRESSVRGIRAVITVQRIIPAMQPIAVLCESRLILRMPNRQEHVMAGGNGVDFTADLKPGETTWRGLRTQLAHGGATPGMAKRLIETVFFEAKGISLVVSAQPRSLVERLRQMPPFANDADSVIEIEPSRESDPREFVRARPGHTVALVADAETWQYHFGAMTSFKGRCSVLFDRCTVSEFRSVSRLRTLPPPLADPIESLWLLATDGSISRVRLPSVD
jgi:DNA segregation ATPase FtsK/SpoIIIE, S-DNA-T family